MFTGFVLIVLSTTNTVAPPQPLEPVPTPQQLKWQRIEYGMFCHFGINTFHNLEWSDGTKKPETFNPSDFDGRQWVKVAGEVGMKYLVATAKHHDGFCLYPTKYTDYSVKASPWRDGKGDIVREVADACHDLGVMFGFYLSPWDRHEPSYENSAQYDEHFKNQLRELLTGYGEVGEVWFDGAGSEGHVYDWDGYYSLIRELRPDALIAICGPDIRWVGNEDGVAPDTLWNVVGEGDNKVWKPAECDVPIRGHHWFFHTNDEKSLRSIKNLIDIYYRSVGHGANLLLNVSPDRRGLLPDSDVERLREMHAILSETFDTNITAGKPASASNVRGGDESAFGPGNVVDEKRETYWATDDGVTQASVTIDLGAPATFNRSMVQEHIALGQRVEEFAVEVWTDGQWREVTSGTTIGHKRLNRFPETTARKVRFVIGKSRACPVIEAFGLYHATSEPRFRQELRAETGAE